MWWAEFRRGLALWLMPEESPAQRKLLSKRAVYKALNRMPRGEAMELMAEVIAETVAPLANQSMLQPRIPDVVALAQGLETSDFIYLLSDATRQYLQQKILIASTPQP